MQVYRLFFHFFFVAATSTRNISIVFIGANEKQVFSTILFYWGLLIIAVIRRHLKTVPRADVMPNFLVIGIISKLFCR